MRGIFVLNLKFNRSIYMDWKSLFISFIFLFTIPILSEGAYYEIHYFNFILNKTFLSIVMLVLFLASIISLTAKSLSQAPLFLFFLGFSMVTFNLLASLIVQNTNFMVTGLILMLAPLFYSLSAIQIKAIVTSILIVLILLAGLRLLDAVLNISVNPITEIRLTYISELGTDVIRLQNNSLFGQKNALGSILSMTLLLFLSLETLGYFKTQRVLFCFITTFSFILLMSSTSAGGIIVGLFGIFFWMYYKTRYAFILSPLLLLSVIFLILSSGFDEMLSYKLGSASSKIDLFPPFFLAILESPSLLIFGYGPVGNPMSFYTESTFLDMILNFGVFLPFVLMAFLLTMVVKTVFSRQLFLSLAYGSTIFLLLTQNSSFLIPNIICFLILGNIQKMEKQSLVPG